MDQSLIYRLALEAGFPGALDGSREVWVGNHEGAERIDDELRRFAALVAEECAKVIDAEVRLLIDDGAARKVGSWEAASANIRAKFKEPTNG